MVHKYTPEGAAKTAFSWRHTVLPSTVRHKEIWICFVIHLSISAAFYLGIDFGAHLKLDWNDLKTISGLQTFFQVFFANQCNTRYSKLYKITRQCVSRTIRISMELRIYLAESCPDHCKLCARYLIASLFFLLEDLAPGSVPKALTSTGSNVKTLLIKPDEWEFLQTYEPREKTLIMLSWAARIILLGTKKAKAPPNIEKNFSDRIISLYADIAKLQDLTDIQVPFGYYHLLNLMVVVNMLLWAYAMALSSSWLSSVIFLSCLIIFTGMVELATALARPFGDEEKDFPSGEWISEVIDSVDMVLSHTTTAAGDEHWEHVIQQEQRLGHLEFDVERIHRDHHEHRCRTPWQAPWFKGAARSLETVPFPKEEDPMASSSRLPPPTVSTRKRNPRTLEVNAGSDDEIIRH